MAHFVGDDEVITDQNEYVHSSFSRVTGTIASTETKITASDGASDDFFGYSVDANHKYVVVGAYRDDNFSATNVGGVYLYDTNGNELRKFMSSQYSGGGAAVDEFGTSVAIGSGRVVVGAPNHEANGFQSGAAYIYGFNSDVHIAKITANDNAPSDNFGRSVSAGCGRIVVGAPRDDDNGSDSGSAYIFDIDGVQIAKLTASDGASSDGFGLSVAVGCGRVVVGSWLDADNGSGSGSAYIFDLDGNELAKLTASDGVSNDYFGFSVAVGSGRIVVGAFGDDDDGNQSGSAYIFDLDGNEIAKITASDGGFGDNFGRSVSAGSSRIVVGAYLDRDGGVDSGSAYIFDLDGNEIAKITASDADVRDNFAQSVAVGSGYIAIGAPRESSISSDSGAAYIYELDETHETYFERILDGYGKA